MPWKPEDVDKHKKGLSTKQKKQWVAIANSVHAKCMKDGGDDSSCAVSAIKQANGSVMSNSIPTYENINTNYEIRKETYQNESYLVVPVVMMVEGVHAGSQGPLLHTISDLGKFPGSWNGIPIVVDHPEIDGNSISANSPDILDSVMVGRVFNTHVDGDKLAAEAWLRETKLIQDYSLIFSELNDKKPIEVSVGVFTENEDSEGDWKGEHYNAIARNHRPDHLALLPGGTGACSVEDGCGIRTNKKKGGKTVMSEIKMLQAMKLLNESGFIVNKMLSNADGYTVIMDSVRRMLNNMDSEDAYYYLEELYDNSIVYCKRTRNGGETMYKEGYTITDDQAQLTGNPTQVIKKVDISYVANDLKRTKINNNKGGNTMADEKKPCGQCMEKVVTIINSNKTHFTAEDREWLLTQDEAVLDKLLPKEPEKVEINKKEEAKPVEITREQILQALSAEDRAALSFGQKQLADRRANWIQTIQANTSKEIWPDATLIAMNEDTLERVFNSVKKEEIVTDYSFNSVPRISVNRVEEEGLYPTGIEIETKK